MGLGEAARLMGILLADPSSATGAAAHRLTQPVSLEARVIADLWDLVMGAAAGKKAVPYKRPWMPEKKRPTRVLKPAARITQDEFKARWAELTARG